MRHAPSRRSVLQFAAGFSLLPFVPALGSYRPRALNIFFDFESSELTKDAAELADTLAREILPSARVTLSGNADTAETSPDRISYARGNELLKHFLRKQSLAKVRFNVVANGISKPLIRTGPNIKEPQNRRVEVVIE
ncbi:MAG: OmpA family protein [Rhizobiales bacterium]|jgi:OOP family OmpA-OmpF porin|nr:OmpA family protein [Hyphomicrobiales bacterium]